ncbi:hypothetical protein GN956_G13016 [Arapaima gigas]
MNCMGKKFKFKFRQGSKVLFFEPDPKEAEVLCDAKVIHIIVAKDERGRRVPKHLIHFSGSTISTALRWNAASQVRVTMTAASYRRRRGWKKRRGRLSAIDSALKHPSEEKGERDNTCAYLSKEEQETSSRRESEDRSISIEIPDVLKKKLEDDCYYINKKKKLVKIPCQMNVVSILESYVKHFAINATFSADERYWHRAATHTSLGSHCGRPEKNEELCKEMVDGLRITFDFTLPMILLYPSEHAQFKKVSSSKFFLPSRDATPSLNRMAQECPPASPRLEPSNPLPADSHPPLSQPTASKRRRGDRDSLHSLRRSARCSLGGDRSSRSGGISPRPKRRLADQATPTSRLPLSHEKNTPGQSGCSSRLPASPRKEGSWLLSSPESRRNNRLSEVLSWKLTPDNYPQRDRPPPPSCMYGAQHLLRLFVKLPEILGKMHLPDRNLRTLVTHLELFLRFLAEFHDDFFPESAYVSTSEAHYSIRGPCADV